MDLEERLDRLERAHRALSAQFLALQTTCRVMLPLIDANPLTVRRALLLGYDISNEQMEAHQFDEEFQADVRNWLEVFSEAISEASDIRTKHRS